MRRCIKKRRKGIGIFLLCFIAIIVFFPCLWNEEKGKAHIDVPKTCVHKIMKNVNDNNYLLAMALKTNNVCMTSNNSDNLVF